MTLKEIIARLRNHPDNELAMVWVANNYSKLDLIKELEALAAEKPYQASVCTECPDARRRKMTDDLFADENFQLAPPPPNPQENRPKPLALPL